MNEHFDKLFDEALDLTLPETWAKLDQEQMARFKNKFGELIVLECAEVAEDYDGAHYVGTAIKQHFGIEG